jgi:hypothetical protein
VNPKKYLKAACVVVGVLAFGSGTGFAATGGNLILGHSNSAGSQTNVSNSGSGPVLSLSARAGQPPLVVSGGAGKATNLNADKLDGVDGSQYALKSRTATKDQAESSVLTYVYARLTQGTGTAVCPGGTRPTGGGVLPNVQSGLAAVLASSVDLDASQHEDGWFGATVPRDASSGYDGTGTVFVACSTDPAFDPGTGQLYARRGAWEPDKTGLTARVREQYVP